jgi:DNA-binding transcriptional MerR regulator
MKKIDEGTLYISFSEVAKQLNIKPHILRYWEKRIPQLKTRKISNRKFFKKSQVEIIFRIKKLLEEGYTLEGIKRLLQNKKSVIQKEALKEELLKELEAIYKRL